MRHVLDNPIWEGLNTGNKHFASGNETVKFFPSNVTTFAGFRDFDNEAFRLLYQMLPPGSVRATFVPHDVIVPEPWFLLPGLDIYQMIHTGPVIETPREEIIEQLSDKDIPAMLNLARLTNPGPFNERTIDFGNFFGIYSGDLLVAMAGQRLQVHEYSEISAVCTHPDHQGRGYARKLLLHQLQLIRDSAREPMLHVKTDNQTALALYESLGFRIRRKLGVIIFKK